MKLPLGDRMGVKQEDSSTRTWRFSVGGSVAASITVALDRVGINKELPPSSLQEKQLQFMSLFRKAP
jgi:hypothetical protein